MCTLYPIAYVCSATSLTVLNQSAAALARKYGAPVATITAVSRSIFSVAFGLAPAASIALYGAAPWLPLLVLASVSAVAGIAFVYMAARRWTDPVVAGRSTKGA